VGQTKTPPKRSVLIAARIITTVVSLCLAEGMLWFEGYPDWWRMDPSWGSGGAEYQADPQLGWRLREGSYDLSFPPPDPHQVHYTIWSEGRRATSKQPPPPGTPAAQKLQFFGDSYVQGYSLSDEESFPWMVQQRHPELEVSNYGTGFYGTYQSYLAMQRAVHGPSTVYYLFNEFHEGRNAAEPAFLRIMKKSPSGWFYPYAQMNGDRVEGGRAHGDLVWSLSRHIRLVAMAQEYRAIFESFRRVHSQRRITQGLLVEMNQLVAKEGGTFTVILFDMDPKDRPTYRRFLEQQHIAYVDFNHPEMNDRSLRQLDGHPAKGLNQLVAGWLEPLRVDSAKLTAAAGKR